MGISGLIQIRCTTTLRKSSSVGVAVTVPASVIRRDEAPFLIRTSAASGELPADVRLHSVIGNRVAYLKRHS